MINSIPRITSTIGNTRNNLNTTPSLRLENLFDHRRYRQRLYRTMIEHNRERVGGGGGGGHQRRNRLALAVRTILQRQQRLYQRRFQHYIQEQEQQQSRNRIYQQSQSELTENQHFLQLSIDVPGVNAKDIKIEIDTTNHVLSISAKRYFLSMNNDSMDGSAATSMPGPNQSNVSCITKTQNICRRYSIKSTGNCIDIHKMKATLHNGVLVVVAPKIQCIPSDTTQQLVTTSSSKITEDVAMTDDTTPPPAPPSSCVSSSSSSLSSSTQASRASTITDDDCTDDETVRMDNQHHQPDRFIHISIMHR